MKDLTQRAKLRLDRPGIDASAFLATAWLSTQLESQLFEVDPLDATSYIAAAGLQSLPSPLPYPPESATRVNPIVALRQE